MVVKRKLQSDDWMGGLIECLSRLRLQQGAQLGNARAHAPLEVTHALELCHFLGVGGAMVQDLPQLQDCGGDASMRGNRVRIHTGLEA